MWYRVHQAAVQLPTDYASSVARDAAPGLNRPRQAKSCLRTCPKCTDSDSSPTCAKSQLGICSPLIPLRKHTHSNILRILPRKNENFQIKNSGSFHISAQNIDCGY